MTSTTSATASGKNISFADCFEGIESKAPASVGLIKTVGTTLSLMIDAASTRFSLLNKISMDGTNRMIDVLTTRISDLLINTIGPIKGDLAVLEERHSELEERHSALEKRYLALEKRVTELIRDGSDKHKTSKCT